MSGREEGFPCLCVDNTVCCSLPLSLRLVTVEEQRNLSVCDFVKEIFCHKSKSSTAKISHSHNRAARHDWVKNSDIYCTTVAGSSVFFQFSLTNVITHCHLQNLVSTVVLSSLVGALEQCREHVFVL